MKIGVIGTGMVGRQLAEKCASLGHDVVVGTRNVSDTLAQTTTRRPGMPPVSEWLKEHGDIRLATMADAASHGEIIVNALSPEGVMAGLDACGAANLAGKPVIDITNPLKFENGVLSLTVAITDSLGEQIQRAFPDAHIVKALHNVGARVMTDPQLCANGDHTLFISGNDANAKARVTALLQSFGWRDIFDLGDISGSRSTEAMALIWFRVVGITKSPFVNLKLAK